eukprot:Awhi_evm1s9581
MSKVLVSCFDCRSFVEQQSQQASLTTKGLSPQLTRATRKVTPKFVRKSSLSLHSCSDSAVSILASSLKRKPCAAITLTAQLNQSNISNVVFEHCEFSKLHLTCRNNFSSSSTSKKSGSTSSTNVSKKNSLSGTNLCDLKKDLPLNGIIYCFETESHKTKVSMENFEDVLLFNKPDSQKPPPPSYKQQRNEDLLLFNAYYDKCFKRKAHTTKSKLGSSSTSSPSLGSSGCVISDLPCLLVSVLSEDFRSSEFSPINNYTIRVEKEDRELVSSVRVLEECVLSATAKKMKFSRHLTINPNPLQAFDVFFAIAGLIFEANEKKKSENQVNNTLNTINNNNNNINNDDSGQNSENFNTLNSKSVMELAGNNGGVKKEKLKQKNSLAPAQSSFTNEVRKGHPLLKKTRSESFDYDDFNNPNKVNRFFSYDNFSATSPVVASIYKSNSNDNTNRFNFDSIGDYQDVQAGLNNNSRSPIIYEPHVYSPQLCKVKSKDMSLLSISVLNSNNDNCASNSNSPSPSPSREYYLPLQNSSSASNIMKDKIQGNTNNRDLGRTKSNIELHTRNDLQRQIYNVNLCSPSKAKHLSKKGGFLHRFVSRKRSSKIRSSDCNDGHNDVVVPHKASHDKTGDNLRVPSDSNTDTDTSNKNNNDTDNHNTINNISDRSIMNNSVVSTLTGSSGEDDGDASGKSSKVQLFENSHSGIFYSYSRELPNAKTDKSPQSPRQPAAKLLEKSITAPVLNNSTKLKKKDRRFFFDFSLPTLKDIHL